MEVVKDSFEGSSTLQELNFKEAFVDVVEDSFEGSSALQELNFNKKNVEEDEVQSANAEVSFSCGCREEKILNIDLNKFPEDEENDNFVENEKRKVVRSMLKIYLHKFY